jgi:hypothetical protein
VKHFSERISKFVHGLLVSKTGAHDGLSDSHLESVVPPGKNRAMSRFLSSRFVTFGAPFFTVMTVLGLCLGSAYAAPSERTSEPVPANYVGGGGFLA